MKRKSRLTGWKTWPIDYAEWMFGISIPIPDEGVDAIVVDPGVGHD